MSAHIEPQHGDRTMRFFATVLLLSMALLFFCSIALERYYPWFEIVRSFSEAAMVGALADWFAVTALFRKPLGLPIPHTAVIPRNKERIGRSLGEFIEQYLISEKILSEQRIDIAGPLSKWLANDDNRAFILKRVQRIMERLVDVAYDPEYRVFFREVLLDELSHIELPKLFAGLIELITEASNHEVFFDEIMKLGREHLLANQAWIKEKIRDASPWFIPAFVDSTIVEAIINRIDDTIEAALSDPSHELRMRFRESVRKFVSRLQQDSELKAMVTRITQAFVTNKRLLSSINSIGNAIITAILADLGKESPRLIEPIDRLIIRVISLVDQDQDFCERLNRTLRTIGEMFIGEHRHEISDTIARTLDSWDTPTLVGRLESYLSKDLQFIRINGTLVGGLVGLIIYFVSKVF